MSFLTFIKDEDLIKHTMQVFNVIESAASSVKNDPFRNVIDPFSAVFDAMSVSQTLSDWLELSEKKRQIQKSMTNAVGDFHENILGSIGGWEKLTRSGIDLVSMNMKVIAEVKNKFNTMKGNTKQEIYDVLEIKLNQEYQGFTAYAVQIIPKKHNRYNKTYTPSHLGKKRPENKYIREIDGYSFYALASGVDDALEQLYMVLPSVIEEVIGGSSQSLTRDPLFQELFSRAYSS